MKTKTIAEKIYTLFCQAGYKTGALLDLSSKRGAPYFRFDLDKRDSDFLRDSEASIFPFGGLIRDVCVAQMYGRPSVRVSCFDVDFQKVYLVLGNLKKLYSQYSSLLLEYEKLSYVDSQGDISYNYVFEIDL